MKINLLSYDGLRPDKRAISKCIVEISTNINESLSNELTNVLLDGDIVDIVDIEINNKNSGSSLRALRKLNIDYEIIE